MDILSSGEFVEKEDDNEQKNQNLGSSNSSSLISRNQDKKESGEEDFNIT